MLDSAIHHCIHLSSDFESNFAARMLLGASLAAAQCRSDRSHIFFQTLERTFACHWYGSHVWLYQASTLHYLLKRLYLNSVREEFLDKFLQTLHEEMGKKEAREKNSHRSVSQNY